DMCSQLISRLTASCASTGWAGASPRWCTTGAGSDRWRSRISCSRWYRPGSWRGGRRMASSGLRRIIALGLLLVAASAGYLLWRSGPSGEITGVVRTTEIRVAPEVGGQLAAIKVEKGARARAGDAVAALSALELTAAVAQAQAALAAATASRDHVYAGVRVEQIAALAAEIAKAKSKLTYVEAQLVRVSTLARGDVASQQALDQATN